MILDDFNRITGLRVDLFISNYSDFVKNGVGRIINYYTGVDKTPYIPAFRILSSLIDESDKFNEAVIKNTNRFNTAEYWNVIELLDNIRTSLDTTDNTYKWVRSTIAKGDFNTNPEADVILGQQNTLEDVAYKAGYVDPNNSWVTIAMRNDLDEEAYTTDGGNVLKINILNGTGLTIDDVVDQIFGDSMYGKDMNIKMSYSNNDVDTVVGKDCQFQSYTVLLQMKKGDVPEFTDMGLGVVIGGNMSTFSYPTILRQLHRTFYRDSSVKSVAIVKFDSDMDKIDLSIQIESKFGEILQNPILI